MKYMILSDMDADLLEEAVNDALGQGWEPIGGVAVHTIRDGSQYHQALIKRETEEDARR